MINGFIKLHRILLDSEIFASEKGLKIWLWILLKANYKQRFVPLKIGKGEKTVKIKRGQFLFGRFSAEEELNINGSTIYKWLKKMEANDMIKLDSNNHYTIVSVCKYNEYNDNKSSEVAANEQPLDSKRTANEQPTNTTKKENKVNKDNKEDAFNFKNSLIDLGIDKNIVEDWLKVRKTKKASNTETAFKGILSQIEKSNMSAKNCIVLAVENSWAGFKAEWINNTEIESNKIELHLNS